MRLALVLLVALTTLACAPRCETVTVPIVFADGSAANWTVTTCR